MAKAQTKYVCRQCGYESAKWLGKCPSCDEWGTLEETITMAPSKALGARSSLQPAFVGQNKPQRLGDVPSSAEEGRILSGIGEFDRVLGGGIVRGALTLIGGDPGIGKSTLLTQVAGHLAMRGGKTLYVSGEESATQIKLRAERLGIIGGELLLHNETDVTQVTAAIQSERPAFAIIDSIQTMQHPEIESAAGSVSQVRAATAHLAQVAKGEGIPIFLVGHVTKEGTLAGPRVLEHMVDTVLTFEGDKNYMYRVLRAVKNRFGSTDEIGLFEMHEEGLVEVPNPSEMLLAERTQNTAGSAVLATVEGTRPMLIEVQALVAPSYLTNPRRTVSGVDTNRVNLILAVLEKRVGMGLASQDVFVNLAGGVRVDEPAADLAVAVAVASNFQERPVDNTTVFAGEVGLGGEIRAVGHIELRLKEAARMGFKQAIVCSRNKASLRRMPDIHVIGVDTVRQALDAALSRA
ncbi:MAG: DNA repair protein RadA [Janthinobacterium lividum]